MLRKIGLVLAGLASVVCFYLIYKFVGQTWVFVAASFSVLIMSVMRWQAKTSWQQAILYSFVLLPALLVLEAIFLQVIILNSFRGL